jgi:hypothetical protein
VFLPKSLFIEDACKNACIAVEVLGVGNGKKAFVGDTSPTPIGKLFVRCDESRPILGDFVFPSLKTGVGKTSSLASLTV